MEGAILEVISLRSPGLHLAAQPPFSVRWVSRIFSSSLMGAPPSALARSIPACEGRLRCARARDCLPADGGVFGGMHSKATVLPIWADSAHLGDGRSQPRMGKRQVWADLFRAIWLKRGLCWSAAGSLWSGKRVKSHPSKQKYLLWADFLLLVFAHCQPRMAIFDIWAEWPRFTMAGEGRV